MTPSSPSTQELTISASGSRGALAEISREERSDRTRELLAEAATAPPAQRDFLLGEVVVLNCRVADAVAARYRNRGTPLEDLRQTAYEGLVKAVQRYDPSAAEDLLTFAVPTIRGEVQRYLRDRTWLIRPPRQVHVLNAKIRAASAHLVDDFGREPTAGEICDYMGLAEAEYDHVRSAMAQLKHESLDRPLNDGSGSATLGDLVDTEDSGEDLLTVEARALLGPALRCLNDRERRIVFLRFFEERTHSEIAKECGIGQSQVSRILERVMRKLREAMAETPADLVS